VKLKNLYAVAGNYYDTGVRRFAVAGMVESSAHVDDVQATLAMPVTVARLTVSLDEIERRLTNL